MRRALIFTAALGCSAAVRAPIPPPSAAGAPPVAPARFPARIFHAFDDSGWAELQPASAGAQRLLAGGRRPVEVVDGALHPSDHWLWHPVRAAFPRAAGGWRLVTVDGAWDLDTWLGRPRSAGLAPRGTMGRGAGRPCFVRDGSLVGAASPAEGAVIDAAFADERHGAAVVEPGLLWWTADGGAHWSRHASAEVFVEVLAYEDRFVVGTASGHGQFNLEGEAVPDVEVAAVRPVARDDEASRALVRGGGGPAVWIDVEHRRLLLRHPTLAVYDRVDDSLTPAPALPTECTDPSTVHGGVGLVRCGDRVFALEGSAWRERLRVHPCEPAACAASADGARVTCTGRCDERSECGGDLVWCEADARGAVAEHRLGSRWEPFTLLGYVGSEPLFVEERSYLDRIRFALGGGAPRPLTTRPPAPPVRSEQLSLGFDGLVRVVAQSGGRAMALAGAPGGPFAEVAPLIPRRAMRDGQGPADFTQVLSDGATFALDPRDTVIPSVWSGGRWEVLRAAPDDPVAVGALDPLPRDTRRPDADAVSIAMSSGWGRWGSSSHAVVLGAGEVRSSSIGGLGIAHRARYVEARRLSCEPGASSLAPHPLPLERGDMVRLRNHTGASLRLDGTLTAPLADSPTPDDPSPAPRVWPRALAPGVVTRDYRFDWFVLDATAAGFVLARAERADDGRTTLSLWRSGPSPPRAPFWRPPTGAGSALRLGPVARERGVVAALFDSNANTTDDPEARVADILVVRPGSAPWVGRVALSAEVPADVGVYVAGVEAGLARRMPDGRVLGAAPGEPMRVLARELTMRACGEGARGDVRFRWVVTTPRESVEMPGGGSAVARFAIDGDALCLRGIVGDGFALAPRGDAIVGGLRAGDSLRALRCAP